jgi:P-type conjugative transfer ATPase TrbB
VTAHDLTTARQVRMLRTALGPIVAEALEDPDVVEVMLNPDGSLWTDRLSCGRKPTGHALSRADGERIIRLIATHVGQEAGGANLVVSAELPESGERFEGVLPPVVFAPTFSIRKRASLVFTLERYVRDRVMTADQAQALRRAVLDRRNVVIAGPTSSGKTTLANALLDEIATTGDRVVVIEDTTELQCSSDDQVSMRTRRGQVSMADLVRSTLRLRPDRIVIGEVRGGEALDLLKAWGTGHPGGVATLHAGSAIGALQRLEQLIAEAVVNVPRALIAEAVNVVVLIDGRGGARRVRELVAVTGLSPEGYRLQPLVQTLKDGETP